MYWIPPNLPNGSEAVSTKVAAEAVADVESTRVIMIDVSSGVHINVFRMVFILVVSFLTSQNPFCLFCSFCLVTLACRARRSPLPIRVIGAIRGEFCSVPSEDVARIHPPSAKGSYGGGAKTKILFRQN